MDDEMVTRMQATALALEAEQKANRRRFTVEEQEAVVEEVCEQLSRGVPLAVVCRRPEMPSARTVAEWAAQRPDIASGIARARIEGFDVIAARTSLTARGYTEEQGGSSSGDVQRDKLIIDTDLKLLSKWDPKRWGDSVQMRMADADGGKLDTAPLIASVLDALRATPTEPD